MANKDHQFRADVSRFLVHLTRDYQETLAEKNLLNILRTKEIEARNVHCLVHHDIPKDERDNFKTVCFTETPLDQIKSLVAPIPNRKIELKPYGLVFWKNRLLENGVSPALYINAFGTKLDKFVLNEFRKLCDEGALNNKASNFYALINTMSDTHNFHWEREWRHIGNMKFSYRSVVAIIAEKPTKFDVECRKLLTKRAYSLVRKIPIIRPNWDLERIVDALSCKLWEQTATKE